MAGDVTEGIMYCKVHRQVGRCCGSETEIGFITYIEGQGTAVEVVEVEEPQEDETPQND